MTTTSTFGSRRIGAVAFLAGMAALAVLAAGCEQRDATSPPVSEAGSDGVGSFGEAERTVEPTEPGRTVAPPPPPPPGPTDLSPTYPGTAAAYAEAVLGAWAGNDPSWLEALTSDGVAEEIFDLNASPYDDWTFLRCDGAAGSSYCSFVNAADGDVLTIRISNQLVGQANAAVGVSLDKTVYPGDGVLYVKEFVEAWQFGNTVRMLLLSSPEVVDAVPSAPTGIVTYPEPTCCGGGLLQVNVQYSGKTARFDVGTTLLGAPNAILDYTPVFGLTL